MLPSEFIYAAGKYSLVSAIVLVMLLALMLPWMCLYYLSKGERDGTMGIVAIIGIGGEVFCALKFTADYLHGIGW